MKFRHPIKVFALVAFVVFASTSVRAEVSVQNAWVRATPGAAKVTAGYAVIVNSGPKADRLLAVSISDAAMTEIHQSMESGGIMKMDALNGLDVPAGGRVEMKPGGYHLMIMGLTRPLKVGEGMNVIFKFRDGGDVAVAAKVAPLSAQAAP